MEQNNTPLVVSVPCYRCNRYHRIVPLANMLVISRVVLSYRYKQFKNRNNENRKSYFCKSCSISKSRI